MFDMVFCKDFLNFYNQITQTAGNRFYPANKNNKPMETVQTKQTVSGKSKVLVSLHILIIRERSSGSVVFDMALYYAQCKRRTFINEGLAWE